MDVRKDERFRRHRFPAVTPSPGTAQLLVHDGGKRSSRQQPHMPGIAAQEAERAAGRMAVLAKSRTEAPAMGKACGKRNPETVNGGQPARPAGRPTARRPDPVPSTPAAPVGRGASDARRGVRYGRLPVPATARGAGRGSGGVGTGARRSRTHHVTRRVPRVISPSLRRAGRDGCGMLGITCVHIPQARHQNRTGREVVTRRH